jgi:hypothetical protein
MHETPGSIPKIVKRKNNKELLLNIENKKASYRLVRDPCQTMYTFDKRFIPKRSKNS